MSRLDFAGARDAYRRGENVTETLRQAAGISHNTPEIIEMAYDLQAGSYARHVTENRQLAEAITQEVATALAPHLRITDTLLDVGTGEMTYLSMILGKLPQAAIPRRVLAFDISWSRVASGRSFARRELGDRGMGARSLSIHPFVAEIGAIPLLTKSVEVVTSYAALEPNGGQEHALLRELFRVTKRRCVLFEPCYEIATVQGRVHMEQMGYIRGLGDAVRDLGGTLVSIVPQRELERATNPITCFVIDPPGASDEPATHDSIPYADPGSNTPLIHSDGVYFSEACGVSYPVIHGIPILRTQAAVLTSALAQIDGNQA